MKRTFWLVAITAALFPALAVASNLGGCLFDVSTQTVTVVEGPESSRDGVHCKLPAGFTAPGPGDPEHFDLAEPSTDSDFDPQHPISDYFDVSPQGNIQLVSDPRVPDKGLTHRLGRINAVLVDEAMPTVIAIHGVTYNVFSEGGPTIPPPTVPEPGMLALFGTGLLSLAGIVRRRLRK